MALARYPHLMPDPHLYRVHLGRGPAADYPYPDFSVKPIVVYWFGPATRDDELLHEIGHVVQKAYISDDEFDVFKPVLGGPQYRPIWWDRDPMSPTRLMDPFCEAFADAFQWAQTANHAWSRTRRSEFRRLLRPLMKRGPLPRSVTV